jgi:hypothetical protein
VKTKQQLSTVSRELDVTRKLLQEQQQLFSETHHALLDLRSENESNKILKARSDIHLSISQNALAEAVAENSTLKEKLTVAQSDSTFYERERNTIWAALCSVRSTLDPDTEEFDCRAVDFRQRVDFFAAKVASRLPPPWAPPAPLALDLSAEEQLDNLEEANKAYAEELRSLNKAYLDSLRQSQADKGKIQELTAENERLQLALLRHGA